MSALSTLTHEHRFCSVTTCLAQKTADSESEDRNAVTCLQKDSGYWNREPCPASGYASKTAFGRFSASQYELRTGIISSLKPCTTSVGWRMALKSPKRSPVKCSHSRNAASCAAPTFGPDGGSRSSFRCISLAMNAVPAAWLVVVGAKKIFCRTA